MDLEQYRIKHALSYEALAKLLGWKYRNEAHRIALGRRWLRADRLEDLLKKTKGEVTLEAMHRRRCRWLSHREDPKTARQQDLHLAPDGKHFSKITTVSELIDALGGVKALQLRYGGVPSKFAYYKAQNRIPDYLHVPIYQECVERGLDVVPELIGGAIAQGEEQHSLPGVSDR